MKLYFPKTINQANFLPRQAADSIPFSTQKLPEILNHFSVKPNSIEAKIMKQTIGECEVPSIKGEVKFCATSLEYLIEFSVSRLGRQVQVHSTEVVNEGTKQVYRIAQNGVEKIGDKSVICHKQNYVYAVFYCHEVNATRAYSVSLAASDGTKAKAVAVCHTDTRFWSPQHLAFQVLKVKPGTVPVCHFLPNGNLIWVTSS
ncbi:BURP domain containing protein [Trema orientale]|uniref:BURP domain containing protein n=1 Tax=Trema orientale TaxID=63057 RepID=A0A2P5FIN5_TREOI|nr:BURP domain containing protein [Trema orientale]